MATVTMAFAHAFARAAGFVLTEDGALMEGGEVIRHLRSTDGRLTDTDYFDLIDWIDKRFGDRTGLVIAYASAINIDDVGALGLAVKTAPSLRDSIARVERYFRLLSDSAVYVFDEDADPPTFAHISRSDPHPILALRDECALAAVGQIFRGVAGTNLQFDWVSFSHARTDGADRLSAFLGCPIHYDADRSALAISREALARPNKLGDVAVSRFLTEHLDTELGALSDSSTFERSVAEHLSRTLSNGIPKASSVARAMGMSERTLFRRLAESNLTYQSVLEKTQESLAKNLLADSSYSISEVAFLAGFSEQSSFNRAFKRWVGESPGAYRRGAQSAA